MEIDNLLMQVAKFLGLDAHFIEKFCLTLRAPKKTSSINTKKKKKNSYLRSVLYIYITSYIRSVLIISQSTQIKRKTVRLKGTQSRHIYCGVFMILVRSLL